jgi:hypothetical protein
MKTTVEAFNRTPTNLPSPVFDCKCPQCGHKQKMRADEIDPLFGPTCSQCFMTMCVTGAAKSK